MGMVRVSLSARCLRPRSWWEVPWSVQVLYRLRADGFTHHITCRVCGHTAEVDGHDVWEWARKVAFLAGFTLTGHTVELTGVCAAHAGAARDASAPGTPGLADAEGG
jgi:hypothetical protein